MRPYYRVSRIGCGGEQVGIWTFLAWDAGMEPRRRLSLLTVIASKPCITNEEPRNAYRDLSAFGTLIGFRGLNYWFADESVVGCILKLFTGGFRNARTRRTLDAA